MARDMSRKILIGLIFSAAFLAAPGAEAQQNSSPGGSADSSIKTAQSARRRAARRRSVRRRTARIPAGSQRQPSRERYRQIQQALTDAGFDPGPVDGFWGPNSEDAMADFQEAHDLEPTGRIDALSLIRLGLGPEYETPGTPAETPASGSGSAR